jgi:hypothetical protein
MTTRGRAPVLSVQLIQAAQRMVARGERPLYRVTIERASDGYLVRAPDVPAIARVDKRSDAAEAIKGAIALVYDIPAETIDLHMAVV